MQAFQSLIGCSCVFPRLKSLHGNSDDREMPARTFQQIVKSQHGHFAITKDIVRDRVLIVRTTMNNSMQAFGNVRAGIPIVRTLGNFQCRIGDPAWTFLTSLQD